MEHITSLVWITLGALLLKVRIVAVPMSLIMMDGYHRQHLCQRLAAAFSNTGRQRDGSGVECCTPLTKSLINYYNIQLPILSKY